MTEAQLHARESVAGASRAVAAPMRPRRSRAERISDGFNAATNNPWSLFGLRVAAFAVLLAAWQLCSGTLIDSFWISSPSDVASRIGDWIADGSLWGQIGTTLLEAALGFLIGAALGSLLGAVAGYYRALGKMLEPIILAFYSMPAIALAPLFLLWFGIGIKSKVAVSAATVLFIVFFNVYTGLRNVDQDLLDTVRVFGAKRRHVIAKVITPSVLTYLFLGLKVSLPFALIGATVAEMVSSTRGLGFVMQNAVNQFDTTGVFVGLVIISAVSVLLGSGLRWIERSLLRWKVEQ
jgi:sulfonate transport system permease protein